MKHISLFILFLTSPSLLFSQIDIEKYRQSVIEYSYTLKMAANSVDYASHIYQVRRVGFLPSLTLSGEFSQQLQSVAGQESWNFALQPQLTQTLYSGGSIRAEAAKAELGVEVAQMDASYDLLEICYSADYNYYNLAAMSSYRDAVGQYVDIITSLKDVVLLRYNEGYIAKGDLLMIETRLSEAIYEQIAFEESSTIALQKFNILRGMDADIPVEQVAVDVDAVDLPQRATMEELLLKRPDYIATTLTASQALYTIDITRAAYNPSISLGIAGSWQPQYPNINGATEMNGSIFLKLSSPLFHFGERRKSVRAVESLHRNSELSVSSLRDDIREEESNMWATLIDSQAKLDAARRALSIGGENLEISTFSYSEGLTTILDVMQAQISWLQLYTNSILSEFNYLVSISAYRRITASFDGE